MCRPANGCAVLDDPGIEVIFGIVEVNALVDAMPMHVEGGNGRDRFPMHEGIRKVEEVSQFYVAEAH